MVFAAWPAPPLLAPSTCRAELDPGAVHLLKLGVGMRSCLVRRDGGDDNDLAPGLQVGEVHHLRGEEQVPDDDGAMRVQ